MSATKRCAKCGEEKHYSDFSARAGRGGRPRSRCRSCCVEDSQDYQRRNPEKARQNMEAQIIRRREKDATDPEQRARRAAYNLKWREENYARYRASVENGMLRKRYGMGRAELEAMLAAQGGKCLLCERAITWATRHVDHIDTPDGPVVRGILCMTCNTCLGGFRESADLLRKAADYVARFAIEAVK